MFPTIVDFDGCAWNVVAADGTIVYDQIEKRSEVDTICRAMNHTLKCDWDAIESIVPLFR